ncbi:tyrosine-protein phosphatase [Erythrobacter sp. NFXS35]|uniref:tyrosine-protein phosphatase n=1 Tax=Erythrobacter sp. NFXS35 TaxID=2818436 RepID=UPI0032DEC3A3
MRRMILLPLAALALLPACEQAAAPVDAAAAVVGPVAANAIALKDERRVLDLEGGINFRDLGGYRTNDGRVTRWEVLYRSGSPAGLTARDQAELARRGIRTICDFRATEERAAEPNPYTSANTDVAYWTRDYTGEAGDLMAVLGSADASAGKSRAAMIALYRELPDDHAESFRQMFAVLAEGKVPLAFNCTAGKDRTGVAAALILTLLGVPRETVVADYALSDDLVDYKAQIAANADSDGPYAALAQLPWDVVEPLVASDPAYVESALSAIEAEHGSVGAFIADVLAVTPAMETAIISNLTVALPAR